MPLIDNFDSYTDGNLASQGSWTLGAGENWVVNSTITDASSAKSIKHVSGAFARNLGSFTNATSGIQRFRLYLDTIGGTTPEAGSLKINLCEAGSTRKGGWWVVPTTTGSVFKIQLIDGAEAGTDMATGLSADTWYTIDIQWDATLGLRGRVGSGAWTSYVAAGTFAGINAIELQSVSSTSQFEYLDTLGDGAAVPPNSNFLQFLDRR